MKKIIFITIASLFILSTEGYAQKWLKKLEKVAKTVDEVLDSGSSTTTSENSSTTPAADLSAQPAGGTKIVTNHPDLVIKLKRCQVSGKTCVIDLLMTNVGSNDIKMTVYGGGGNGSFALDDEGNQYTNENFRVSMGGGNLTSYRLAFPLLSNSPIKVRMQIEGIVEEATNFTRIQLNAFCHELNLGDGKNVMFYNIPISREGDE